MTVYEELASTIKGRKGTPNKENNSYTSYLFEKGLDKILKKVGEESSETIIAAKNGDNDELKNEIADLLFHLFVLAEECGLDWKEVEGVLEARAKKTGNLKEIKSVDKNT